MRALMLLLVVLFTGCGVAEASPRDLAPSGTMLATPPVLQVPEGIDPEKLVDHSLLCFWEHDAPNKKLTTTCMMLDMSTPQPSPIDGAQITESMPLGYIEQQEFVRTMASLSKRVSAKLKWVPKGQAI